MKGTAEGGAPVGVRGHPPSENFGIFSPRKCDSRRSEAKSACFNVSFFFKLKFQYFCIKI